MAQAELRGDDHELRAEDARQTLVDAEGCGGHLVAIERVERRAWRQREGVLAGSRLVEQRARIARHERIADVGEVDAERLVGTVGDLAEDARRAAAPHVEAQAVEMDVFR